RPSRSNPSRHRLWRDGVGGRRRLPQQEGCGYRFSRGSSWRAVRVRTCGAPRTPAGAAHDGSRGRARKMRDKPPTFDDPSGWTAGAATGAPPAPRERRDKVLIFAGFVFDGPRRLLLRDGTEVPLRPQTFDVLRALIHSAHEVVAKDALFAEVWRGVTVTDDS